MPSPIPNADVTCEFGVRGDAWAAGYHTGRDYRARTPLRVNATAGGRVVHAGTGGWGAAYGVHVIIESRGVRHMYAHLSSTRVRTGDSVKRGDPVGVSGATGHTFGAHLHYEERQRPYRYLDHRRPRLDAPTLPKVNLDLLVLAFNADPERSPGRGLHPRMVRIVEQALIAEGFLSPRLGSDGYAGTRTRRAYRKWQQSLGFAGADADGIPGLSSLTALGAQCGFVVTRTRRRRTLSAAGARLIAKFEGFRPELYNDPAGHCTIGYGHLVHRGRCDGTEPERYRKHLTKAEARRLLREDARPAGEAVNELVTVPLTQPQFDALTSFVFNLGAGNLADSELLTRLNDGQYHAVPQELSKWVYADGQKLAGLIKRRAAEGRLFSTGAYPGQKMRAQRMAKAMG